MPPELISTLFNLLALTVVCASLAWWWEALRRWWGGEPICPPRYRRPVSLPPWPAVVLVVLLIGLLLAAQWRDPGNAPAEFDAEAATQMAIGSAVEGVSVFCVLATTLLLTVASPMEWVKLGFRTDRIGEQVREGAGGFIAAFVPVYLVLIATSVIRSEESTHPLLRLLEDRGVGWEMGLVTVVAVLIAPLKEELMFRAILQPSTIRLFSLDSSRFSHAIAWGIGLTALVFSAVHGFPDSLGIFPLALVLGVLFQQRRSYLSVVVTHMLFNGFNTLGTIVMTLTGEPIAVW